MTIEYGIGVGLGLVAERRPDHVIVATGAEPQRPWWVPEDATNVADVRAVLEGDVRPFGGVMVIDEIGFHHADVGRRAVGRSSRIAVEIVTPGMVVGQDLGVTLDDMENWWIRATAKGIVQQRTDLVPMGMDRARRSRCSSHPTGEQTASSPDWVVLAVPQRPVEWLYHELVERTV